ncbi:adenosine deaminase [Kaistella antarctica]|uniref:Adenine deaminase n=1 Tax=Kaistella antarctica TaxID=266748 RepID=A0A3S4WQ80_9FLAO|nr:adenosine deaminase [Kaistella antarctica]KEY19559.1 adenine deaminase [Kaistella antarctica]SEW08366.1 adenosine deaminase [Kaistella antarctica]VEH97129.1 Adenine deaminase [Kaistella antarctica]
MTALEYIKQVPKAELHLHIEGSFEPELMFEIAQRNKIEIPYATIEDVNKAYQFSNLQDFLDIYYAGANVLIHEQDFYDLTMAYFKQCAKENVLHAEIMFDPQTHTKRGVEFSTVINGIQRAREEAEKEFGISSLLIMSYLRHLSEEDAFETLQQSLPYKHLIKAVGLDSSEKGNPPSKFQRVFEASIKEGYVPVAHAGEEGPAEYIYEALDLLKIARIDHGNNCLTDPKLVERLVQEKIGLTVCPLSNTALRNVDHIDNHPLKKMLDLGLKVTVNSDDPAYFGGYLTQNYISCIEALDLSLQEVKQLVRHSFEYSFLSEQDKEKFLKMV